MNEDIALTAKKYSTLIRSKQMMLVRQHKAELMKIISDYITEEFCGKQIMELADIILPGVEINFSIDNFGFGIKFGSMDITETGTIYLMTGDAAEQLLDEASRYLHSSGSRFSNDFMAYIKGYGLSVYYFIYCQEFITKMLQDVYRWYIRMSADNNYLIDYIRGIEPARYISSKPLSEYIVSKM